MPLQLYNTLTRRKEPFVPLDPERVGLYVCGPTVYDRAHIGNARPVIVFDVLFRLLRHVYGADHVRYVRNITDVDDKIIARAAERGIAIDALTEETTRAFREDVAALGCLPPSVEPRATEHIPEMVAVIERLLASGHAYAAEGHVLFATAGWPDYGRLSHRTLDEMIAGARVEVAPYKRDDKDFVLWKPARADEPGWPSPWGLGRPGWHIECSAMSWKHLGETFDIHGGGIDLIFPHHENELAQNRCAFRQGFMAKTWMHNGFLQVEGRKMSKSLGNFVTIDELLRGTSFGGRAWPGEVLRLAMLKTHYRQPIDWSVRALEEAAKTLQTWGRIIRSVTSDPNAFEGPGPHPEPAAKRPSRRTLDDETLARGASTRSDGPLSAGFSNALRASEPQAGSAQHWGGESPRTDSTPPLPAEAAAQLADDLNTPALITWLHGVSNLASTGDRHAVRTLFHALGGLGFVNTVDRTTSLRSVGNVDEARVLPLLDSRLAARAARNWAESDRIRDELAAMGVTLKDNKDGTTTWDVGRAGRA